MSSIPDQQVRTSVIVKNVDPDTIRESTENELLVQINKQNVCDPERFAVVNEVIKLGKFILKVTANSLSDQKNMLTNGLYLNYEHIPPTNITKEILIKVEQCRKCFQLSHDTNNCPKDPNYQICSVFGYVPHLQNL